MNMNLLRTFLRLLGKPTSGYLFFFVLILNLLSNYTYLKYDNTLFAIVSIFFLSVFIAYLVNVIYLLLAKSWLRKAFASIVIVIHNIFVISEYFLLTNFQMVLNQDAIDILTETNPLEIEDFLQTYTSPGLLASYVIVVLLLNLVTYLIAKSIARFHFKNIFPAFALCGLGILCLCVYNFVKYRDGMSIPQYTTITRSGYALYVMKGRAQQIRQLQIVCKNLAVQQITNEKPTMVVIIGESFSVYHSSLYGYKKLTNPLLMNYKDDGSLFLFDNVVSLFDATHGAMRADFSLDSLGVDFASQALFPACFKAAGYSTMMYDNQYFVGEGVTFLTDKELSETMFDYRNDKRYQYDGIMVDDLEVSDSLSLYVIHLWGQHYTYSQRFPQEFSKFKANEYDKKYPEEHRQMMADYDNATLYNDFVIDKILRKFEDKYCCVFYFSDHGEEIYELRDYMGHGNAEHSPNLNYQLRVPLMVWFSPSFYAKNEQLVNTMRNAEHYPICTDDIGHSIIDIAGIETKDFAPTRSFVNNQFNKNRHRIVLNSIDYDQKWVNER